MMHAPTPEPPTRPDAFVELHQVTHAYGRGDKQVKALDATDLRIEQGDFIALVGPSGCGKSTILKLVTGLISASSGGVLVAGREVGAEPVRVGMAFQNPTLLPWLTLRDNVIGRDPRCDVWVEASGVSRRHACVAVGTDKTTIADLESSNGTFVGGERIAQPRLLADGDVIELGAATLTFRAWSDERAARTERVVRTQPET
jgi:ABC-type Fe3+/spermidine/putrescine transport system ATPase subunit